MSFKGLYTFLFYHLRHLSRRIIMFLRQIILYFSLLMFLTSAASAKIVFSSERSGVQGVYIMDDDGSNQTLLTESKELRPYSSCWSPNGKYILFKRRHKPHRESVIFLMNPDGTNIRQITKPENRYIGKVSFSPDSTSVVFNTFVRVNDKEEHSINVLNIATGQMKIIAADFHATYCDWSPDGKNIIFSKWGGGKGRTIWIMSSTGDNPRVLIPPPGGGLITERLAPRWSPNGQQIIFLQEEYNFAHIPNVGNTRVYHAFRYIIFDRNTRIIRELGIPKDMEGYSIDWMDDGKSVVFGARKGIPLNIPMPHDFVFPPCYVYKYVIRTGKLTQLTEDPGWDQTIDWISDDVLPVTPVGKKKISWGNLKR